MNFENIDTIKAFGTIFLGAVVASLLFYVYQGAIRPRVLGLIPSNTPAPGPSGVMTINPAATGGSGSTGGM